MPDIEQLFKLDNFEDKALLGLQLKVAGRVLDGLFKFKLAFSGDVQRGEEVTDQAQKYWVVIRHNFRQVKVSQGPHKDLQEKS